MKFGKYVAVAVIVIVAMIVVAAAVLLSTVQTVKVGDTISVYYTGSFTNGTVFGSNVGQAPFNFTVGAGQLIPGFDNGVIGMSLNQNKTITVPPQEGYGYENSSLIMTVPANVFGVNSTRNITIGTVATRIVNGQQEHGIITAVGLNNVTVNFNSPLAGKTLIFKIKVVAIHNA